MPALDLEAGVVAGARAGRRFAPELRAAVAANVAAAAFLVLSLGYALLLPAARPLHPWTAAVLVLALALVNQVSFEVGRGFAVASELVVVPMALALPARLLPVAVALGFVLAAVPQVLRGSLAATRLPLEVCSAWHALGLAAVLAAAGDPRPAWHHWPLYAAALGAQFLVDGTVSAVWTQVAYGVPFASHLQGMTLPWLVDVALAPLGLSVGLRVVDAPLAILLLLPLVGLLGYFARERRHRLDHAIELSHAYRGTALLLGDVIEADDAYTGSHSRAVVELTLAVCDELGVDLRTRRDAELAALLHDVGKVRIPAEIINKPSALDADERATMDRHTLEGERMLEQVGGLLGHVGHIVRSCHEHWDGGGYPDGLAGEAIPLPARIVCCCDAFHAMRSDRPYRAALEPAEARAELLRHRGTQFDPAVVDALIAVAG